MTGLKDEVDILVGIAQIIAIFVGGSWAYFNFVRRRTLHRRAELNIHADVLPSDNPTILRVAIMFRNTGLAVVRLESDAKVCRLFAVSGRHPAGTANIDWGERLATIPILNDHRWVEAQETINDEHLIALPDLKDGIQYRAYKVIAFVAAQKRPLRRSTIGWTAVAVGSLEPILKPDEE